MSELSPVSGVKRKFDFGAVRAAFDPERTSNKTANFMPKLPLTPSDTDLTRYDAAH